MANTYQTLSNRLDELIENFNKKEETAEDEIKIDNKTLKVALKEQVTLQVKWERFKVKVDALYSLCKQKEEESYSEAVKKEMTGHRITTISEAREFAKSDTDYIRYKRLGIEIKDLKDEVSGYVECIISRKYVLNNITNSVVAGTENHII